MHSFQLPLKVIRRLKREREDASLPLISALSPVHEEGRLFVLAFLFVLLGGSRLAPISGLPGNLTVTLAPLRLQQVWKLVRG